MGNIREPFTTAKPKRKSTSDALTVELDRATRREIGKIARRAGQAETAVAAEVLAAYVKQQTWFADKIERARRSPPCARPGCGGLLPSMAEAGFALR